ncbi:MAG: 30S ribosomal protein S20 [Planctomycetota bacterium]|jgi:small subunit ribosomal protein S20
MAHTKSSKKRVRQNEKRRLQNRDLKGRMRTAVKAVEKSVGSAGAEELGAAFRKASSELDKAGRKRLVHPNAAARKKSRLAKQLAKASQG